MYGMRIDSQTTTWVVLTKTEGHHKLPHLKELVQCYMTDWVKDDNKYSHYESVGLASFQNQIYEGPDTDIETEMHLSGARRTKADDTTDDDLPSTLGCQFTDAVASESAHSNDPKDVYQSRSSSRSKPPTSVYSALAEEFIASSKTLIMSTLISVLKSMAAMTGSSLATPALSFQLEKLIYYCTQPLLKIKTSCQWIHREHRRRL